MSGSGRAGNGRGNNRRRPPRRRDNDSPQVEGSRGGRFSAQENNAPIKNETFPGNGGLSKNDTALRKEAAGRGAENHGRRGGASRRGGDISRGERALYVERPKWSPPKLNTDPLPVPNCPWCGKPIRDISSAIADKDSGEAVHFDCVMARVAGGENLEKGESLSYIGGGRFGVVSFGAPWLHPKDSPDKAGTSSAGPNQKPGRAFLPAAHVFKIKKIIEWEDKDNRAGWRSEISDHYSVT